MVVLGYRYRECQCQYYHRNVCVCVCVRMYVCVCMCVCVCVYGELGGGVRGMSYSTCKWKAVLVPLYSCGP